MADMVKPDGAETQVDELLQPVSFEEFDIPTYDKWKEEVEKALKGGIFEKKMFTPTYEGITLEPIYTPKRNQEAIQTSVFPGDGNYGRGAKASGYIKETWGVSQYVEDSLPEEANASSLYEIQKGTNVHNIRLDESTKHELDVVSGGKVGINGTSLATLQDVADLIANFNIKEHPFYIEGGASISILLAMIVAAIKAEGKEVADLKGLIGADPVGFFAKEGLLTISLETALDEMAHSVAWAKKNAPGLRTILVSGDTYANGGGNDVQELAYALTTAIYYIREMQNRNVDIHTIANSIVFTVSLGANFFMEIAKLRALRVIWSKVMEAFGADKEHQRIHVHGRTSFFTKTVYDPYVNMLRNTTQAFSGVVGGLDSLEVAPFDEPIRKSDAFSRRIARNMQVMMQTEFELRQPVDPVGGSWYVETLALQLADKIWAEMQVVEGKGGIMKALEEGYPQAEVAAVLQSRFKNLAFRKDVAVGNNMYANMTEELLDRKEEKQEELFSIRKKQMENYLSDIDAQAGEEAFEEIVKGSSDPGMMIDLIIKGAQAGLSMHRIREALRQSDIESTSITAIHPHRWTEQFESMRMRTEAYKVENHDNVKVFLANMGPIPQHKPRADFSTGFFEVAAFEVLKNNGFPTTAEAAEAARESGADVVVICSTDATYPELVPPLAEELKKTMPKVTVVLAGAPSKEMEPIYRKAGVDEFISVRANCYEILSSLQDKKGM